jgi:hypothetical protein
MACCRPPVRAGRHQPALHHLLEEAVAKQPLPVFAAQLARAENAAPTLLKLLKRGERFRQFFVRLSHYAASITPWFCYKLIVPCLYKHIMQCDYKHFMMPKGKPITLYSLKPRRTSPWRSTPAAPCPFASLTSLHGRQRASRDHFPHFPAVDVKCRRPAGARRRSGDQAARRASQ